jgi:hypothetical protein
MVRCTNCGHRWFVANPESAATQRPADSDEAMLEGADSAAHSAEIASAAETSTAETSAAESGVAEPRLDRAPALPADDADGRTRRAPAATRSTAATIGWLAVLLVLLILTGLVLGRNELVALAPQAAPLYQRVGLPVTQPIGLELAGIVSERLTGENGDTLRITGAVRNVAGAERAVPPLRIALLDGAREEVLVREVEMPQAVLAAGASTRFSVDLEDPPADARNFSVTFAVPE